MPATFTQSIAEQIAHWATKSQYGAAPTDALAIAVDRAIDKLPDHHRDQVIGHSTDESALRWSITRSVARLIAYAADKDPVGYDEIGRTVFATLGGRDGGAQEISARMYVRLQKLRRERWGVCDPAWLLTASDDAVLILNRVRTIADSAGAGLLPRHNHIRTAALTVMCSLFDTDHEVLGALHELIQAGRALLADVLHHEPDSWPDDWLLPSCVNPELLGLACEATCLDYWLRGQADQLRTDQRAVHDTYGRVRDVLYHLGKWDTSTEALHWRRRNDGPKALSAMCEGAITALSDDRQDDVVAVVHATHPWLWRVALAERRHTIDVDKVIFRDHHTASPMEQPDRRLVLIETLEEAVDAGLDLLVPDLGDLLGRLVWLVGDVPVTRWVIGEHLTGLDIASLLEALASVDQTINVHDVDYFDRGRVLAEYRVGELARQAPADVHRLGDQHAWRLLPPMWDDREDAIKLVAEHYRELYGADNWSEVHAAAICCSPVQWFDRRFKGPTNNPDPGRGWFDYGIVEDYTTLTLRYPTRNLNTVVQHMCKRVPDGVQAALRTGPLAPA